MFRIQMLCCGKLTCTNTVVVTWPPLNILVNRPCSSWPTLMGRECKRRIIRRQTPYRISVNYNLCFYLFTAMFTSALGETDVCIKVGKYHQLAYPEILDLTVFPFLNLSNPTYQKIGCSRWLVRHAIRASFMSELQNNISNVFLFCHAHCLLLYTHWIPFHLIKLSSHFVGLLFFTSFS